MQKLITQYSESYLEDLKKVALLISKHDLLIYELQLKCYEDIEAYEVCGFLRDGLEYLKTRKDIEQKSVDFDAVAKKSNRGDLAVKIAIKLQELQFTADLLKICEHGNK